MKPLDNKDVSFEASGPTFNEWLDAIRDAHEHHRAQVISDFMAHYDKWITMSWHRVCADRRVPTVIRDDVRQEIVADVLQQVNIMAFDSDEALRVYGGNFPLFILNRARNIAQRMKHTPDGLASLSGATSAYRRLEAARKITNEMTVELGRTVTVAEVTERQREILSKRRSGKSSANMNIRPYELVEGALGVPRDLVRLDDDPAVLTPAPDDDDDELAFPWVCDVKGGVGFVGALLDKARESLAESEYEILSVALGGRDVVDGREVPVFLTKQEVKNKTGKSLAAITRAQAALRPLAIEVVEDFVRRTPSLYRTMKRYIEE